MATEYNANISAEVYKVPSLTLYIINGADILHSQLTMRNYFICFALVQL